MAYILIRNLEPLLRRQLAESAWKNKRSLSDEAIVLMERVLAAERRAASPERRATRARRRTANDPS